MKRKGRVSNRVPLPNRNRRFGSGRGLKPGPSLRLGRRSDPSSRSISSSALKLASEMPLEPITWSASLLFSSCRCRMRSSMVPFAMTFCTLTTRVCPMRCARSVACCCAAAFHQGSAWMTTLAPVRFKPVPPALSDTRNTGTSLSLNSFTSSTRSLFGVLPVMVQKATPASSRRCAIRSKKLVNWLKMSVFSPPSMALATNSMMVSSFAPCPR